MYTQIIPFELFANKHVVEGINLHLHPFFHVFKRAETNFRHHLDKLLLSRERHVVGHCHIVVHQRMRAYDVI